MNSYKFLRRYLRITYFIPVLILITGFSKVFSQEVMPVDTVLMFVHKTKAKNKFINENKKITYWLKDENEKQKGRLQDIQDSFLIIDGRTIPFDQFLKIGSKSTGLKIVQTTGKVLVITGTVVSSYGTYLIIYGKSIADVDGCGSVITIIAGVMVVLVGVPVIIIGAIPLALVGQRFNMEKKWNMQLQIVPDKKEIRQQKRENKRN